MSYVVKVDVNSSQLEGIQETLADGLGDFVQAANKLKAAGDEVKGQLNVTAEIKTIKDSLTAMSGAIKTATTAEVVKISSAMAEIGVSLHNVAISIDNVKVGNQLQTSVDGFVARFAQAMNAAITVPSTTAKTPTATTIKNETVNITSRVDDAILSRHFIIDSIDLTSRVNGAIDANTFVTKPIDLTARIQLAVNAMEVGTGTTIKVKNTKAPTDVAAKPPVEHNPAPISILASQLSFTPITITAADLLAKIRIDSVNIRELVEEALDSGGGKINLYDLIADEIAAGLRNNLPTKSAVTDKTANSIESGLDAIVRLFEEFRASSETEMLAAGDQYAKLEKVRQTIGTVNTSFISLGASINETVSLFNGICDSVKTVSEKFAQLANNVATGKTTPTEGVAQAESTANQINLKRVKSGEFSKRLQTNNYGFDADASEDLIKEKAEVLRQAGEELAGGGFNIDALANYARAVLYLGKIASESSTALKSEIAKTLSINTEQAKAIFNPDTSANLPAGNIFSGNKPLGKNIKEINDITRREYDRGLYQDPKNIDPLVPYNDILASSSKKINDLPRLGVAEGSSQLKKAMLDAFNAARHSGSDVEVLAEFKNQIAAFKASASQRDVKVIDRKITDQETRLTKSPTEAESKVANLITTFRSFYETTLHTIDEVATDFKAGADAVTKVATNAKSKVDDAVRPIVRAVEITRDSAAYFKQLKDAQKAAKAIDVKATEVEDEPPTRPTAPALVTRQPKPPSEPPQPPQPPATPTGAGDEAEKFAANYRLEAGIVRDKFKAGERASLEQAQAAIANENPRIQELQAADFINLRREQYLGILKHNLKIVAGADRDAATQAQAEVNNLQQGLVNEPINTRTEANKLINSAAADRRRAVTKDANYDNASGAQINLNSINSEEGGVKDLQRLKLIERNLKSRLGNILAQYNDIAGIEREYQKFVHNNFDAVAQVDNSQLDKVFNKRANSIAKDQKSTTAKTAADAKQIYDLAMLEYQQAILIGLKGNLTDVSAAANDIVDPVQKQRARKAIYGERAKAQKLEDAQPIAAAAESRQAFDAQHRLLKDKFKNGFDIDTSTLSPTNDRQQQQLIGLNQQVDKQIEASLENRHKSILKDYLSKLDLAGVKARTSNEITSVATPVLDPKYLEADGVKIAQLGYQKSQTDAMNRTDKAKAVDLRDTGTVEALAELEAGFALRLNGYASAMRQLRAELNRGDGNGEFDAEIKNLRNGVGATGEMPDLAKLSSLIDNDPLSELAQNQVKVYAAFVAEMRQKVTQMGDIKFNKKLASVKLKTGVNKSLDPADLNELSNLAVSDNAKNKVAKFVEEVQRGIGKKVEDLADDQKKQVLATLRNRGSAAAVASLQGFESSYGGNIPQQLKDARRSVEDAFQKSILAMVKLQVAKAQDGFDATDANKRNIDIKAVVKSAVGGDFDKLTPANKLLAESQIATGQQKLVAQTKQYDNKEFNDAKFAAKYEGDLTPLADIKAANISTKAREAGIELANMLADLAKMSTEERQHVAEVRAQMGAARSDLTDAKPKLIEDAITEANKLVAPRIGEAKNSDIYLDTLETLKNQGQNSLDQTKNSDGSDIDLPASIQDIAGYYYTLKSVAGTVIDTLKALSTAASGTTRAMMLLNVANDNSIGRVAKDVSAAESLSKDFGGAANDYKGLIGSFKSGIPLEYDKQGQKLPSKLSDEQIISMVRNLQSAGVVNNLNEEQTGQLNLAVQQVLNKSQVQAEELVRQLSNVLPGAVPRFAQAQGMSTQELKKAMEQGNVGLDAFVKFTDKLGDIYGEEATKPTLIKELNMLSGNLKQMTELGAGATAPAAQLGLSVLNVGLEGVKTNMGTLALVALPATIAAVALLTKVLYSSFMNNSVVSSKILTPVKETFMRNLMPLGIGMLGFGISAAGNKLGGEQSLDNVFEKLLIKIPQVFSLTAKSLFGEGVTEKRKSDNKDDKPPANYSTAIGGSLVGLAALQAIRTNTGRGINYDNVGAGLSSVGRGVGSVGGRAINSIGNSFGNIANSMRQSIGETASGVRNSLVTNRPSPSLLNTIRSAFANPMLAAAVVENRAMPYLRAGQENLRNGAELTRSAIANPFVTMVLAENKLNEVTTSIGKRVNNFTSSIGNSFNNLTNSIGGRVTGAVSGVTSAFSNLSTRLSNVGSSGGMLARMGFGRDTSDKPLSQQELGSKASLKNIAGDLGMSFVTTVGAIAIANTTFVSDYSLAMQDLIKKIRGVEFGLNPTNKSATTDELLKGEQAGEFNTDVPTKMLRDLFSEFTGDFSQKTTESLTNIIQNDKPESGRPDKAKKVLDIRRENGGKVRDDGLITNLENSQFKSRIDAVESLSAIQKTVNSAMDDGKYTEDVVKSKAALTELNALRDDNLAYKYKSQSTGVPILPDDQEKRDSDILIASNEYNLAVNRINKRRPAVVEAIKAVDNKIELATTQPIKEFGSKEIANEIIEIAQNKKAQFEKDLVNIGKNVSDLYDSVSVLTKATDNFNQLNKIIDRRENIQATKDYATAAKSSKTRLTEGDDDDLNSRKAETAFKTATNDAANANQKANLADEYVQIVNRMPPGIDQAKKLEDALDGQIEARKNANAKSDSLAQATFDRVNQREQRVLGDRDDEQTLLNNQFAKYTNKVKTGYAPSLDTRQQPNIDATVADQLDNAAMIKAKETYSGLKRIAKSIVVNGTKFKKDLDQAEIEYNTALDTLGFNRKARAKELIQRSESNMYQDMDRGFTKFDTAAANRTIDRTPQIVAFSDINYKRSQASNGVTQANDDLKGAGIKLQAMAIAISKIKSPELKIEKDLEYAKSLTDYKKKQFDVEAAMVNQLKQKYEEIKSAVAEIGTLRGGIAAAQVDGVKQRTDRQLEKDRFNAVGNTGEVNSIESARAAVAQANTISANLPKAIESANVAARDQQGLYAKYITALPATDPERDKAVDRLDKQSTNINTVREELFSGGKAGKGLMANDFETFLNQFSIGLNKFKSDPSTTDKSVGTISLSIGNQKDIKFSGNQQELELTKDLLENYKTPLRAKNENETNRVSAENNLATSIKSIKEKLRSTDANIAKTKLDGEVSAASYQDEFITGQAQFDAELKLVKSKAPDAKNYIDAVKLKTELEDELKQRQVGNGGNRAAKNKLDIDQINAEFNAKSASDPLDVANNKKTYDDKLQSKLRQIKEEEYTANKKLIAAMNSQVLSYLSITDANRNVFKQLAASLISVQMAGITLLKSYGVLAGEVNIVNFNKNDKGVYRATTDRINADDSGKLAGVKAGQEVDAQNDSIEEFKKSTVALTSANTPEALAKAITAAKNLNDPNITSAANSAESALKNGALFDSVQISDWIKLLVSASDNLVRISDAKREEVIRNAKNMENSRLAADVANLNSEINQQYIKNRQTAFRHGSVESTGDIRDMDDKTSQMYSDRIDANRYATYEAVMKEGGESTTKGKIALGRGRNKEEEIQNEYADLPLYGKQFSSDIRDAVSSAARFSTVMREAIEKGSWGEAFNSMMKNLLNKLSDTYSDRASKQIGDLVGGGIDSLFGLNKAITGGGGQTLGNAGLGSLFGGGGGGLDIGLGSLLGFSKGSIPSLAMGDYPNGIPGTAYPKTPVQDPREPTSSRLAVINADELVLSREQVRGYQNYKNEIANNSVQNNNNNSRSTVNNYQNSNISMNSNDTFGQSDYSIKQGMRSRFDKK